MLYVIALKWNLHSYLFLFFGTNKYSGVYQQV